MKRTGTDVPSCANVGGRTCGYRVRNIRTYVRALEQLCNNYVNPSVTRFVHRCRLPPRSRLGAPRLPQREGENARKYKPGYLIQKFNGERLCEINPIIAAQPRYYANEARASCILNRVYSLRALLCIGQIG